ALWKTWDACWRKLVRWSWKIASVSGIDVFLHATFVLLVGALGALLALRYSYVLATRIAASVGQASAVAFGLFGRFANPFLLLIAVFIYLGASEEAAAVVMKNQFRDTIVRDAMLTPSRPKPRSVMRPGCCCPGASRTFLLWTATGRSAC